jgi:RHS repeat-associated protein
LLEEDVASGQVYKFVTDAWNPKMPAPTGNENHNVIAVLDGVGSLTTHYLWGDQVGEQLGRIDSISSVYQTRWTLQDRQMSVRDVIDNSATLKDSIAYDGFGNILAGELAPTERGRYGWTGQQLDAETDQQYNHARWYNAEMGRWESQDPLGFDAGDSNLYRYVNNRPTDDLDPSGNSEQAGEAAQPFQIFSLPLKNFEMKFSAAPKLPSNLSEFSSGGFQDLVKQSKVFLEGNSKEASELAKRIGLKDSFSSKITVSAGEGATSEFKYTLMTPAGTALVKIDGTFKLVDPKMFAGALKGNFNELAKGALNGDFNFKMQGNLGEVTNGLLNDLNGEAQRSKGSTTFKASVDTIAGKPFIGRDDKGETVLGIGKSIDLSKFMPDNPGKLDLFFLRNGVVAGRLGGGMSINLGGITIGAGINIPAAGPGQEGIGNDILGSFNNADNKNFSIKAKNHQVINFFIGGMR